MCNGGVFVKKKIILALIATLLVGTSIGAATGLKVQAILMTQKMNVNGVLKQESVLNYEGNAYVPLRRFGELAGIKVDYKDGVVLIGETTGNVLTTPNTSIRTCEGYINSDIFKTYLGVEKTAISIYEGAVTVDESFEVFADKMNYFLKQLTKVEISETDESFVALQYTIEAVGSYLKAEQARIDALMSGGPIATSEFYISEANMLSVELNKELDKCGAWEKYNHK